MGTAKRERQKANRQQRLEELAREARREKTKKRGLTIAVVVVGGLVLLFGLAKLVGGDDESSAPLDTSASATTLDPTATTTATSTDGSAPAGTDAATTTEAPTTTEGPTTTVARAFEYGTAPCPAEDGSSTKPEAFEGAPQLCIDPSKTYTATVVTNKGEFTIALNTENAPGNVNNFVTLARWGYYDGTNCHRVITDFVVQCGRPKLDDEQAAEKQPGYTVPDELPAPDSYEVGTVAMANTGSADSGGGQWFIITGSNGVTLPPKYTVLGTVTSGLDSTVKVLASLADPLAMPQGVPPLSPIDIESVTITQS